MCTSLANMYYHIEKKILMTQLCLELFGTILYKGVKHLILLIRLRSDTTTEQAFGHLPKMNNNLGPISVRDKNIFSPGWCPLPNGYGVRDRQKGPLVPVGLPNRN